MPKNPKAIVLDSWATIAYLEDEAAAEKVADIIADAHEQQVPLLMTVVNAGEVWYIVARQTSAADADTSIKQLRDLGIEFIDADWNLARDAGYFKSKNKMSFADCFAAFALSGCSHSNRAPQQSRPPTALRYAASRSASHI